MYERKSRIDYCEKGNIDYFSNFYNIYLRFLNFCTHRLYDDIRTCYARVDWAIFETIFLRLIPDKAPPPPVTEFWNISDDKPGYFFMWPKIRNDLYTVYKHYVRVNETSKFGNSYI